MAEKMEWTAELKEKLKGMMPKMTYSMIAAHFGVSRNSVSSIVKRDKELNEFAGLLYGRKGPRRKGASLVPKKISKTPREDAQKSAAVSVLPEEPELPEPEFKGVRLLSLRSMECKWPQGESPAITFCGAATGGDGESYCKYHSRLAYKRPVSFVKNNKLGRSRINSRLFRT